MTTNRSEESKSSREASLADGRIAAIDGLRGLAVFHIVLFHYFKHTDVYKFAWPYLETAPTSLKVFFAVSGFLIFLSLLRRVGGGTQEMTTRIFQGWQIDFWIRRAFRIFPLWWLVLTLHALVFGMTMDVYWINFFFLFGFVSFDPYYLPIQPAWSLFVEETFYLFMPLFFVNLQKFKSSVKALMIFIFVSIIWSNLAGPAGVPTTNYFIDMFPLANFQYIFLGIFFAHLYLKPEYQKNLLGLSTSSKKYILDLAAIVFYFGPGFGLLFPKEIAVFFILVSTMVPGSLTNRICTLKMWQWVGIRCYGVYLLHVLVLSLFAPLVPKLSMQFNMPQNQFVIYWHVFCIVVVLILADLSWKYFELPLQEYGKKVSAKLNG